MIRISKPPVNIREKLSELERPIGLKGSELMRAETLQDARDLVSAGRKNLLINGDMRIAQRGTSANVPNLGQIGTVDRWNSWINYNAGGAVMSQETDAPAGFHKSLKVVRNDSSAPAQYFFVGQKIEAQSISQLGTGTSSAKPFTISFWVKSNRPGTYNLECLDDDGSHHLVKQYTINSSGVWEYKTITFPPNTVGGVPTYDNTLGLDLNWWLSSNANTTYTSGSLTDNWAAYATNRRNAGGNAILDTGQYWMITGVQLEVGKNATEFEHRSYGEELALCQRYFQTLNDTDTFNSSSGPYGSTANVGWQFTGSDGSLRVYLPVSMRTNPTATVIGTPTSSPGADGTIGTYGNAAWMPVNSINAGETTKNSVRINVYNLNGSGKDAFGLYFYGSKTTSTVILNAEL
jgi:hypothetical protein